MEDNTFPSTEIEKYNFSFRWGWEKTKFSSADIKKRHFSIL